MNFYKPTSEKLLHQFSNGNGQKADVQYQELQTIGDKYLTEMIIPLFDNETVNAFSSATNMIVTETAITAQEKKIKAAAVLSELKGIVKANFGESFSERLDATFDKQMVAKYWEAFQELARIKQLTNTLPPEAIIEEIKNMQEQ